MSQWSRNAEHKYISQSTNIFLSAKIYSSVHNAFLMLTRRSTETDFAIKLIPIQQRVLLENTQNLHGH